MRACFALLLLAGCPTTHYLTADVMSPRAPVEDALIAVDCGRAANAAYRTDTEGRARMEVQGDAAAPRCSLTVAKPGYRTVVSPAPALCTTKSACPPVAIPLEEVAP